MYLTINVQGAETLLFADDINILKYTEYENILIKKIIRIMNALETS
jgi:hypothetical protein